MIDHSRFVTACMLAALVSSHPGPAAAQVFIYPSRGQSPQQEQFDKGQCYSWAVQQSGFDPTRPGGGVAESENESARANYRRAEGACLEGRGYSVK